MLTGETVLFTVSVAGTAPFSYQWQFNNGPLSGETNLSLLLSNVQPSQAGEYAVQVSNDIGSLTSSVAVLTVVTNGNLAVVPPLYANTTAPGGGSGTFSSALRLQEIYDSSLFTPGPIVIQQLRWRPHVSLGQAFSALLDLQIDLSTSQAQPESLSSTFANNVGSNDTEVFHGSVALSSAFSGPPGGPKDFDIIVPLTTPFLYDPAQGHLLVDVRNFSGSGAIVVEGAAGAADHASRAFSTDPNASQASAVDHGADVLGIIYTIPQSAPSIFSQPLSQTIYSGETATLNIGAYGTLPLSYEWFLNGQSLTGGTNATFQITGTQPTDAGDYSVIVANAFGSVTSQVATLSVLPSRTLALTSPAASQEGTAISVPLQLFSEGDVGGMTFALHYDSNYLRNAEFVWSPLLDGLFNTVNYSTLGEIQATFALSGNAAPAGTQLIATVNFLLRSVPNDLDTALTLQILDVSSPLGDPITAGNLARNASARINKRLIIGDNNANQRLDVGDATVVLRFLTHLDTPRSWDINGNDLNSNQNLDSGDALKILRVAAGIDPQPGGGGAPVQLGGRAMKSASLPIELMLLSPVAQGGDAGAAVTFQVQLQNVNTPVSGASFTLDFPTNALRLANSQAYRFGALVPAGALAVWNVSPAQNNFTIQDGHLSLAVSSASAWPASNGVLAEITFQVQPSATNRYAWPLILHRCEITPDGFANRFLLPNGALFLGRNPLSGILAGLGRDLSNHFHFSITGDAGASYTVEVSTNLINWAPLTNLLNSPGSSSFVDPDSANQPRRFYRTRPSQ